MRAIVIRPTDPPVVEDVRDYNHICKLVGGSLEALAFLPGTVAYIDEEAKVRDDKPPVPNLLATQLCNKVGSPLWPDDFIAGTMVIFGTLDERGEEDGEEHDVPEEVIDEVMRFARLRP